MGDLEYALIDNLLNNKVRDTTECNKNTVATFLQGHPFYTRNVAFLEGWPLVRGRSQYIYV